MTLPKRNISITLAFVMLFICSMGFFNSVKADTVNMNVQNQSDIYGNGWLILFLSLAVIFAIFLFFKNFTKIKIENLESFTTYNALIVKIRALSILSLLIFPVVEYYEGVYLKAYTANWQAIGAICLISFISLLFSFKKDLSFKTANFLPQFSYYLVYLIVVIKTLKTGAPPIMSVETACLILFSKLIFNKLKNLLYFLLFVLAANLVLFNVYTISGDNFNLYISAIIQASIVSAALYVIEGSSNRKVAFGNKILESSSLFILVADADAEFVFVNNQLENTTGLSSTKILGNGWWEYLGHDSTETAKLKKLITDSIAKNQISTYESTIKDLEGNTLYVSWDNSVIDGKFLLAVGKNITQTKLLQLEENKRKVKIERYGAVINELTRIPYSDKNNLNEVLQNICNSISTTLEIERVSIWDYYDSKLVCVTQYNGKNSIFENGAELHGSDFPVYFSAIGQARIINAPDALNNEDTIEFKSAYFPHNNIKSLLDVPIFINGKLKGVLCCEQSEVQKIWDSEDINFVKAVADFVALSIEASKRKEIEREFRYILNNVGDIIYTTDALGNFDFINKTASKILGYDVAELKGQHFSSIIHQDYKKRVSLFYLKQFKQGIENTYQEFKVINKNGESRWVGQSVKLVYEKNGDKIKGFQAVVRDITKQKETEIALVNSENNLRQLNENINETFYLYNYAEQKFDYISPNCATILGATQNYFYQGNDFISDYVISPESVEILNATKAEANELEIEYRIKSGVAEKWIKEKSFPIKDTEGRVIKRSGICSDITEKKLQEETLKELSLVASTVSNGVVITNSLGLIEWCNASFLSLTEYALDELVGKRPIEVFSGPETPAEVKEQILKTTLENSNVEILQYTKSGKLKWFLITNTTIVDDWGGTKKQIEIITDITERKALEKEYRYILNNAADVIYTTNEKGYIVFLNDAITKILGFKQSEVINTHFTSIIHPDDKKRVAMFYLKQFASKKEDSYCEFRVLDKEGQVHWVGQNVKLVQNLSPEKEVLGFQSILRDITKQKETELALIESENNFRQISEAITDVFYLYDLVEDKYDYISPNSINILGVDSLYFYYTNNYINDYVIEKDRHILKDAVDKIKDGIPFEIEYRVKVDFEIRWIKEKSFIIKDSDGRIIKTSGTCVDVTQKKMQEKNLLKINRELSVYSEDLAINNLLKEQLIYTNSFEEIARVSLNTLKLKIPGITRGSLLLVNENNNGFEVYYLEKEEVLRENYDFGDLKSYKSLKEGKKYIEHDVELATSLSKSDILRKRDNIRSYILLPINYSKELIGALALEFETNFSLTRREMDILENFTSVLSVVVNKLNLQKQLSEKSKDILASLNYAKSIQQSILPNIDHHKNVISKFMSLYMPKDVVSGDFFVVESFDEYTLLALGDCTGHGVPGAFLTLLGSNFLQRIAIENKVASPASILESLDYQLFTMLNKNRSETIRDGMELGLCIYNQKTKTLTFAGAGLFLVYYRNNEQIIVQGSKRSIGDENHSKVNFEEVSIELNGTEKFYLFSDGYRDQLGGIEKRKRFSRARFLDLLNKIKNLPPFQQEFLLKLELEKHKGKVEQTDDISVIGFELK